MKPIAITLGDPAGIGPEIIAKAFRDGSETMRGCFVAGDLACLRRGAAFIQPGQLSLPIALIDSPAQALDVPPRCIPLLQVVPEQPLPPMAQVSAAAGRIAADWGRLERAVGVLHPVTRASAWVCSDGQIMIDWEVPKN